VNESMPSEQSRWGVEALALGISLGGATNAADFRRSLDWAIWADAQALHSVWVPEMHFAPGGVTSPLLNLAAYAARTQRIRLATTSVLLPIHHPMRIAQEVAALDRQSGGRVILGLGRGFRAPLFSAFGIDPATKRDRFDESLDLMLASWRGESVDLTGTCFESMAAQQAFQGTLTHQRPHPPLAVAAFGRKGLAQAARRGLPYLASPMEPFDLIRENLKYHRDELPDDAARTGRVVPVMRTAYVSDDPAEVRRVMTNLAAETRIPSGGAKLPASIARALQAPLADRVVVGSTAEVHDRLARYREELGMNLLIVRPQIREVSTGAARESLQRLTGEILPALSR
jgi:alkanesulfonate monooxygenase SsuD/methylene tetrahydromethanopterin reductase-like flavin-dependent oxidoreductase (luciferase family)